MPALFVGFYDYKLCSEKPWRWLTISKDMMINEQIRAREVRLVGANGDQTWNQVS